MDDFTSKQKINVREVRSGDNEGRCAQARRGSLFSAENFKNRTERASPFIDSTGLVYNAITHRSENLDVLNRENGRLTFVSEEDLVTPTPNKGGNGQVLSVSDYCQFKTILDLFRITVCVFSAIDI